MFSDNTAALGPDASTDGAPPAVIASSEETTALPSIQVYGSAAASDTDLPQSVDTVDRQEISEQAITRLQDALRNVPGITLNAGEGGSHGDSVNLRGLSVPDSFFLDGLRDIGQYQRDTFNLDSVSVLLGPSSVLFGRGSTAGVINAVSKQPELLPRISATASVGTAGLVRGTGDFNWVLGDTAAARLDVMDEHSGVAERDQVRNRRSGFAPTIALGIATPTRLSLSFLHQEENNIPDYGIPFIDGAPARVNRSNFYGLADYDRTSTDTNIITAKFEHDLNDDVTLSNTLRAAHYGFTYLLSAPHLDDDFTQPPAPGTPLADILIYRDQPSSGGTEAQLIDRTDLVTHFDTGHVGHALITGIELSRETSNVNRYFNGIDAIAPTPLLDPNPLNAPPTPLTVVGNPDSKGTDVSVYAIDSLSLTPKWDLDAGLRWDRFNSYFNDTLAASAFSRADAQISPRAALVYKPGGDNSVYLSYGSSYNPAIEYLTLAPTSASLAPEKDRTVELGTKWQWMAGKISAAGALFDAKMSNARIADPDDPTVQQQPFDQRVIGVELGIAGHITERLGVKAGYTHLDDRIVATSDAPALGRVVPNIPRDAFDIWATFTATSAWTFAGGVNYAGYRYADTHNTAGVPAYAVFNAMAAYRANQHLSFQLNLDNLTNKLYFNSIYYSAVDENHAVPGAGRSLILSASIRY